MLVVSDIFVKDVGLKQLKRGHPLAPGEAVDYMAFVCVDVRYHGVLIASLCEGDGVCRGLIH